VTGAALESGSQTRCMTVRLIVLYISCDKVQYLMMFSRSFTVLICPYFSLNVRCTNQELFVHKRSDFLLARRLSTARCASHNLARYTSCKSRRLLFGTFFSVFYLLRLDDFLLANCAQGGDQYIQNKLTSLISICASLPHRTEA